MSIIQEALKKAQKNNLPNSVPALSKPAATEPAKENSLPQVFIETAAKNNFRPALYAIILIIVVSAIALKYFTSIPHKTIAKPPTIKAIKPAPVQVAPASKPPVIQYDEPVVVSEPTISGSDFVLSGVMHLEDGPRAIINNRKVGKGDNVGGATVKSITDDVVILEKMNEEITLRLR